MTTAPPTTATAGPRGWLVPVSGPPLTAVELEAGPCDVTVGRGEGCGVRLPADAERVSRQHARFAAAAGVWRVADLGSRWGTFLNGVQLPPRRDTPLGEGDLIRIAPWTFHFTTAGVPRRGLVATDDAAAMGTMIHAHPAADARPAADGGEGLALLLEAAAAIHAAGTEAAVAEALVDAAARGTGLATAAVLRPLDAAGRFDVVAARSSPNGSAPTTFSRSLIAAASGGSVAELSVTGAGGADVAVSIVQMGIRSALCVPLMLGSTVAAYLYLDSRGGGHGTHVSRGGAAPFCLALSRMAGLALANLKRVEVERRQTLMEFDLTAAAAAQRWILPPRVTTAGPFTITGESRPGEYVGGDFFDVIRLADDRVAVALGDVAGHGVAASVLMTAAQGFLHAALKGTADVAGAVTDLSAFVCPRRPPHSFVTLWVGVFDAAAGTVTYVDAGHGYAALIGYDGVLTKLDERGHCPLGVIDCETFTAVTVPLPAAGRATVVSDGIIEQFCPGGTDVRRQFGLAGLAAALPPAGGPDAVAAVFDAVVRHAGSARLQDDATAVVIGW